MAQIITVELLVAVETLSKEGSYFQAAEKLGITLDLLGAQIAELEEQLEFHLFETHGDKVELSAEGQALVSACRVFLEKQAESKQRGVSE